MIELSENADIGRFKRVPNVMSMNIVQKRYDSKILLVHEEILKGYMLLNVAEIMNAHRKRQICQQIEVEEDYPVRYQGVKGTWGEYLLKSFVVLGAVSYAIYEILASIANDIMSGSPFFMAYVGIAVSGFIGIFALYCIITGAIDRIKRTRGTKNAISCSYKGIHLVNDVNYTPCIAWSDVKEIRVDEDNESKLIIELKDSASQSQKIFEIKNKLADTSVYEVGNVLNDYRQFHGY